MRKSRYMRHTKTHLLIQSVEVSRKDSTHSTQTLYEIRYFLLLNIRLPVLVVHELFLPLSLVSSCAMQYVTPNYFLIFLWQRTAEYDFVMSSCAFILHKCNVHQMASHNNMCYTHLQYPNHRRRTPYTSTRIIAVRISKTRIVGGRRRSIEWRKCQISGHFVDVHFGNFNHLK